MKIIISGGGTGGHIFPALSIANEIRRRFPEAGILFIGAKDRMEMQRVPEAGYKIKGLPVSGFNRSSKLKNIGVAWRLLKSLFLAHKYVRRFKPDAVVGVGGYASGPTLWMASLLGIPTILQEQNSYAGITNKLLAKRAAKICVAYRGMNRFFPADRIVLTGNPVRKDLENVKPKNPEAYRYFSLQNDRPVLLVLGGSLGARTVNNGVKNGLKVITDSGVQVIWQTGKNYFDKILEELKDEMPDNVWISDFISRMDYAYSIADLVVSRAGAGTISELCLLGKPAILVPSPNVAEDHQTMNALALSDNQAAVLLRDKDATDLLAPTVLSVITDKAKLQALSEHIIGFAQNNSAERIVNEIVSVLRIEN
ncbi:MAG: undecaprenyldiphospho-muramoylpentapeptide beta-N-acetylglucosaminyltransferase [Tannerella sp.]|nr:undecaprenyldiphospho-muramoylpentapeptide beta-N-acetylglucosaminyltransferase [Tannerella sp.]